MIVKEIIKEHDVIPNLGRIKPLERCADYPDGFVLNPLADPYDQKFFFKWETKNGVLCYKASHVIGAQRIENNELIIQPGIDNLDFIKMFGVCLLSDISPESFAKIYSIDLDEKPLQTKTTISSSLTPLLIVHFLMLMKQITARGLRRDYINRNENLKKVKGRIDTRNNERKNVFLKRFDRVYCDYSELSFNIPENRLFKKTLKICKCYINSMESHELYSELSNRINHYLAVFEGVDDNIEIQEIRNAKSSSLYRGYDNAVKLALQILKRLDYSIIDIKEANMGTPIFWVDMALLFEHYVYGLLFKAYGQNIKYQDSGLFKWRPDFLHIGERIIIDTKYIPEGKSRKNGDIIRQLSGYSRVKSFVETLGEDTNSVVPCLILYPVLNRNINLYRFDTSKKLLDQAKPMDGLIEFYEMGVPLPVLK